MGSCLIENIVVSELKSWGQFNYLLNSLIFINSTRIALIDVVIFELNYFCVSITLFISCLDVQRFIIDETYCWLSWEVFSRKMLKDFTFFKKKILKSF